MRKEPCPKRALLALDIDPGPGLNVVEEAARFAAWLGAELTGLFVLDATWNDYTGHDWLSGSNSRADFLDWVKDKELAEAQRVVQAFEAAAASVPHRVVTRAGRVVDEILAELAQGYDALIMPKPFRRGLEIMRNAECDVLKKATCSVYFVAVGNETATSAKG
jgi:nucleotide-binding universal stress UspA family protein